MARLKMCLMIHIEDSLSWLQTDNSAIANAPGNAVLLGALASIVGGGTRGAKISLQVDFGYLDQNAGGGAYPGGPSSLQGIASFGGNFWCHTHCSAYGHLRSVHACVQSAFGSEIGTNAAGALAATAGRSGGADMNDPTLDWASIS